MRITPSRPRSGITLTEILISILIMGVGLVSLATLFPVGLERIRRAQRNVRSAQLVRSALADIQARNLLGTEGFQVNPWILPAGAGRDPWITDFDAGMTADNPAVYRGPGLAPFNARLGYMTGEGLPVALDPLWWAQVNAQTLDDATPVAPDVPAFLEVTRFGRGPTLRPNPTGGGPASAYGLQRLTTVEFLHPVPGLRPYSLAHAAQVFSTQDDPVLQTEGDLAAVGGQGSPVLTYVDPVSNQTFNDWTYTWMFTGYRSAPNSSTYIGDIVIFHNRPFGLDTITDAAGNPVVVPAGERVVEAVFGYGRTLAVSTAASRGYSPQDRTVLLRWPAGEPDPEVNVGGWIADVTYEKNMEVNGYPPLPGVRGARGGRFYPGLYPGQRCYWYRVARRSDAEPDPNLNGYRRMIVTVETPLRAKTEIIGAGNNAGMPVHLNAALVCPYVVYVFPKVFHAR